MDHFTPQATHVATHPAGTGLGQPMRLSEAADRYLAQRKSEGYSLNTLATYRCHLEVLQRQVGDEPLEAITLQVLPSGGPSHGLPPRLRGKMQLVTPVTLQGHVRIFGHPPNYAYSRDTYRRGRKLHDHHNAIQAAGLAYICEMLMADPTNDPQKYGITQIGVDDDTGTEVHKADLTDQYVSGASVINVLYLTSVQPATQPVNLEGATLYLDDGGLTELATATFDTIAKTNLLALTVEWTVTLS